MLRETFIFMHGDTYPTARVHTFWAPGHLYD